VDGEYNNEELSPKSEPVSQLVAFLIVLGILMCIRPIGPLWRAYKLRLVEEFHGIGTGVRW